AQNGTLHPMLAVRKPKHRPPQQNAQIYAKATAAAAVELLMRSDGLKLSQACSIVARAVHRWSITLPTKNNQLNATTIKGWRAEVKNAPRSSQGNTWFRRIVERAIQSKNPSRAARELLKRPLLAPPTKNRIKPPA